MARAVAAGRLERGLLETRSKRLARPWFLASTTGSLNDLDHFYFPSRGTKNLDDGFHVSAPAGVGGPGGTVGWGTGSSISTTTAARPVSSSLRPPRPPRAKCFHPLGMLFPPNRLFENKSDGTFLDVTPSSWQQQPKPSMGVAYADYDHDGLIDLIVGNFGETYTLYHNAGLAGAENHWLTVRLEGRPPINRDAIGARVYVTTPDGLTRMQEVKSGSALGAGNDTALHFGLEGSEVASVRVVWPDGTEAGSKALL